MTITENGARCWLCISEKVNPPRPANSKSGMCTPHEMRSRAFNKQNPAPEDSFEALIQLGQAHPFNDPRFDEELDKWRS